MALPLDNIVKWTNLAEAATSRWAGRIEASLDEDKLTAQIKCDPGDLQGLCDWLVSELGYSFATLVVEEEPPSWIFRYFFYGDLGSGQVHVTVCYPLSQTTMPSISRLVHAADWQEREIEDLFGLRFEGHPRLGDFVLHEEWPEGVNPMRTSFGAAAAYPHRQPDPEWHPLTIVEAPGAFMMPVGPVYSDYAESALFLLETVGEDVLRTIPRFFYKYRGVEKIAEGKSVDQVLLLAERFSGTSAFSHSLAFCRAVEEICGVQVPNRAQSLRALLAELERLRHHVAVIAGICQSTALAVATSQASILEEEILRLCCALVGHRYLFGINVPGGLVLDVSNAECSKLAQAAWDVLERLRDLQDRLRFSSSFLDRLEEVGIVSREKSVSFGLLGPVARASGVSRDLRIALPYGHYNAAIKFQVPREQEGDGYARLRVFFREAEQSVNIISQVAAALPQGPVRCRPFDPVAGAALGWVEAPDGAAFHWVRIGTNPEVARYRVMTPSFVNWHGFHLAAEDFAFQDFPIIMATFGLSNAECDR
jgi:formate hydrogenlyase subunit 5